MMDIWPRQSPNLKEYMPSQKTYPTNINKNSENKFEEFLDHEILKLT